MCLQTHVSVSPAASPSLSVGRLTSTHAFLALLELGEQLEIARNLCDRHSDREVDAEMEDLCSAENASRSADKGSKGRCCAVRRDGHDLQEQRLGPEATAAERGAAGFSTVGRSWWLPKTERRCAILPPSPFDYVCARAPDRERHRDELTEVHEPSARSCAPICRLCSYLLSRRVAPCARYVHNLFRRAQTKMTAQVLTAELGNLIQESKRKHNDLRQVSCSWPCWGLPARLHADVLCSSKYRPRKSPLRSSRA